MNDAELLRQFENRKLAFEHWTHRAHVKVAFRYLSAHPFDDALTLMREGVKAYNAAHNVPDGPTEGYNETTTHAFMQLIHATMGAYSNVFPTHDAEAFCETHPQLMTKHILRLFYSPQRRMHPDAKTRLVEPDLAPLPVVRHTP